MFPGYREKKRSAAKYPRLYGPPKTLLCPGLGIKHFCIGYIKSQLSCSTDRRSCARFSQVNPTKIDPCKYFLFAKNSLVLKIKNIKNKTK